MLQVLHIHFHIYIIIYNTYKYIKYRVACLIRFSTSLHHVGPFVNDSDVSGKDLMGDFILSLPSRNRADAREAFLGRLFQFVSLSIIAWSWPKKSTTIYWSRFYFWKFAVNILKYLFGMWMVCKKHELHALNSISFQSRGNTNRNQLTEHISKVGP